MIINSKVIFRFNGKMILPVSFSSEVRCVVYNKSVIQSGLLSMCWVGSLAMQCVPTVYSRCCVVVQYRLQTTDSGHHRQHSTAWLWTVVVYSHQPNKHLPRTLTWDLLIKLPPRRPQNNSSAGQSSSIVWSTPDLLSLRNKNHPRQLKLPRRIISSSARFYQTGSHWLEEWIQVNKY